MYFEPKEVGKRIAKLRELLGYNQEQYSQKINISRSALSKIEIGDRSPSIDLLIEIAELSGVTLDYLILGRTPQEGNKKLGMQLVIQLMKSRIFWESAGHLPIIWSKRIISAVYALVGQFAFPKRVLMNG